MESIANARTDQIWFDDMEYQGEIEGIAKNLDSLSDAGKVLKIGEEARKNVAGNIERVPRIIKHRSAPDPFATSRKKATGSVAIRDAICLD